MTLRRCPPIDGVLGLGRDIHSLSALVSDYVCTVLASGTRSLMIILLFYPAYVNDSFLPTSMLMLIVNNCFNI